MLVCVCERVLRLDSSVMLECRLAQEIERKWIEAMQIFGLFEFIFGCVFIGGIVGLEEAYADPTGFWMEFFND